MTAYDQRTRHVLTFDTFGAFVDAAERSIRDDPGRMGSRSRASNESSDYGVRGWHGQTASVAEAATVARTGWPEGREAVEALSVTLERSISGALPVERMVAAYAGSVVDVGAYLAGDPECFYTPDEDITRWRGGRGPIVRIVANLATSAGVSTTTITRRGAAVVALTDALERCGYRVEIIGTWCSSRGGAKIDVTATVKRPEERVQIDQLAFALAHPSAYRRLAFALWESAPPAVRASIGIPGGYGMAAHVSADVLDIEADVTLPEADLYGSSVWANDDAAIGWVRKVLAEQGVTLTDA